MLVRIFCSFLWVFIATAVVPPKYPPEDVDFTLGGLVPVQYFHVDDTNEGGITHFSFLEKSIAHHIKGVNATLMKIEAMLQKAYTIGHGVDDVARRIPKEQWLYLALLSHYEFLASNTRLLDLMVGSKVLVVGSMTPWIECLMVITGTAQVVTVEYNRLTFEHEKMVTISGPEFDSFYAVDSIHRGSFDFIISMSSLDHDGLGGYGDPINT